MTSLESIYEVTANRLKALSFIPVLTVGAKSPSTKTRCWLSPGNTYAIRVQELSKKRLMICHVVFSQRVNKWYEIRTSGDLDSFFNDRVLVFLQSFKFTVPQLEQLARRCEDNVCDGRLLLVQWNKLIDRQGNQPGLELYQMIQHAEQLQEFIDSEEKLAACCSALADCRTRRVGY